MTTLQPMIVFLDDKSSATTPLEFQVPAFTKQTIITVCTGTLGKQEITVRLVGDNASAHLVVMPLLWQSQSLELVVRQCHDASHSSSSVHVIGAVADHAQLKLTTVTQGASPVQDVSACQHSHILLLSPHACVVSMPSIQSINMNVCCTHGSAISTYDAEQLMYAQSRGLSDRNARSLLLESFLLSLIANELGHSQHEQFAAHIQQIACQLLEL